ncbi:Uncharacterised protein [Legionella pneumophila]|nr:Uncharacterised protein [Legionella pneumophila]
MITANAGIKNIYFNNQLIKNYFFLKPIKFHLIMLSTKTVYIFVNTL